MTQNNKKHEITQDKWGCTCSCGNKYNSSIGARLHLIEVSQ